MKLFFTILVSTLLISNLDAQKIFSTRNGKVAFESPSSDDVKAVNNEVTSRLSDNGQLSFSLLIKGFKFGLAEMQDHFNEKYLESTKYPRADFKGTIVNLKDVNFAKDGSYKITAKGDLTLHGVTKNITVTGTVDIKAGKPLANAKFTVIFKDYNVNGTGVGDKANITVSCQYQ